MLNLIACPDSIANILGIIDITIAPKLLFYSYIPILILSVFLGFFVYHNDSKSLKGKIFLYITLSFSIWIFLILLQWIAIHAQIVHLAWQLLAIFELLIYVLTFYFVYVYLFNKNLPLIIRSLFVLIFISFLLLIPTTLNISYFDITNCEGMIGDLWSIIYVVEVIVICLTILLGILAVRADKIIKKTPREIWLFVIGVDFFLTLFAATNIIGEATQDYTINLFGTFGAIVFFAILAYLIIKYKSFNIKILGAQGLVFTLGFSIFSLIFIRSIESVQYISIFTLLLVFFVGRALIYGVKREIQQREHLELLTSQLEIANEKLKGLDKLKTEFLSLASHQLRSPLTAIKGYASMLLDGSYGNLDEKPKEATTRIFISTQNLVKVVEDLLNVSKIEQGGMKYEMQETDLGNLLKEITNELSITAKSKNLDLTFGTDGKQSYIVSGDQLKLRQVFVNLIDNSIKYTPQGYINVNLTKNDGKIKIEIRDSGIGMSPETKEKLFQKFSRGSGEKVNSGGSGLGLYLAKEIISAHNGELIADSQGEGKGSVFTVTLDEFKS